MVQSLGKIVVAAAALNIAATMAMSDNTDNAVLARDYDDFEVEARGLEDFDLEAREPGIRNRIKGAWRGLRGKTPPSTPPASPAPSEDGATRREFFDDEFELEARDFDDEFELEARDFDDEFELEAREPGFKSRIKGAWRGLRGKGGKQSPPASPAPSEGENPGRRSFDDEFELEARDFDEFELEAREPGFKSRIKGAWRGLRGKGGKQGPPPASPTPSEGENPGRRSFDDEFELEARDFDEFELEAREPGFKSRIKGAWRGLRGKGGKQGPPSSPPASPAPSEGENPGRRDVEDIEARSYELDLLD